MSYSFDQIFAADPSNPERVASNGVVTIFTPGDELRTPLLITTTEGMAIQNPVQVNETGHGPAFMHETMDRVAWEGGGLSGFLTSYDGMKREAVAARVAAGESAVAAMEAAANSTAPTAEAVEREIVTEGTPARTAVELVAGQAASTAAAPKLDKTAAANMYAVKPDNGGKPVGKGEPMINILDYGAKADGASNDTTAFAALEAKYTNRDVDLMNLVYAVNDMPFGNRYFNGVFKFRGTTQPTRYTSATKTGAGRIALGPRALDSLADGYNVYETGTVVALGADAMRNMTAVKKAIAIGSDSQSMGTITRDNIGIGDSTLRHVQSSSADYVQSDRSGTRNVAIGGNAGYYVEGAYNTTFVGRNAGGGVIAGNGATALGSAALAGWAPVGLSGEIENWCPLNEPGKILTTTAVGVEAAALSTATDAIAVGGRALSKNKRSGFNTAIGSSALTNLDINTGTMGGAESTLNISGTYTQTGSTLRVTAPGHTLAIGDTVFLRLLDGASQTFLSDVARAFVATVPSLDVFTVVHPIPRTASGNAHVSGKEAAVQQPRNEQNTAVGSGSAIALETGSENVFVGSDAAPFVKDATRSTVVGKQALGRATSSARNTAVGYFSAGFIAAGATEVTALGANALRVKTDGTSMTESWGNITAVGYDSRVSGANQVQLGDSRTTTHVYGTVQNRSDARDKADIRDTALGLEFIESLRPVDYKWDMRDDYVITAEDGNATPTERDGSKKRNRYHHGFIAQEVQELGVDFGGLQDHAVNGGSDVLTIGYDELIAPLVKAVQELSAQVVDLKAQLAD